MPPSKEPTGTANVPKASIPAGISLTDDQLFRLEKAIVISGVVSGLLASGRIPNSAENRRYFDNALNVALEAMNR